MKLSNRLIQSICKHSGYPKYKLAEKVIVSQVVKKAGNFIVTEGKYNPVTKTGSILIHVDERALNGEITKATLLAVFM